LPLVPWIVATLAIAALAGILVRDWRRPNPKPPVTRFSVLPPEKTMMSWARHSSTARDRSSMVSDAVRTNTGTPPCSDTTAATVNLLTS